MTQENVEIVRRAVEANRSGPPAETVEVAVELAHPDMEFVSHVASVEGGTYRGVDGTRAYYEDLADVWQEWRNELRGVTELGPDTILTENVFRGTARSGVSVERPSALIWTLLEGKVVRLHSYPSREEALQAAGLSE
jgi:ketosteroid isomerase-like protein